MSTTAGLEDVVVTNSHICDLDGKLGKLTYYGVDIHDLAIARERGGGGRARRAAWAVRSCRPRGGAAPRRRQCWPARAFLPGGDGCYRHWLQHRSYVLPTVVL